MTRASAGFSVIEALVAVAVLAVALVPILALQTQVARNAQHVEALRADLTDQQNAIAILRDANPMATPRGEIVLSNTRTMRWAAAPISSIAPALARTGSENAFDVALYRVTIEITDGSGRRVSAFTIDQLGWRRRAAAQQ